MSERDPPTDIGTVEDFTGAPRGRFFERSYPCIMCGMVRRESDTILYRGKRYGVSCGCAKDVDQLASKGG